ncbi:MAG: hypothetical protein N3E47_03860, partial [Candidatus Bathyarchaeota archaeon]|nr:hypothetical protein [Candidatus Bathyarchaeota archaeon]
QKSYFIENLEKCGSYGDIFDLVKKAVKRVLGLRRVGLLLYLSNLPPHIGAYYQVGSNIIVLNKMLISMAFRSLMSKTELNSLIFSILLHEYLHSLGFLNEQRVRELVYEISVKTFGADHLTVKMALDPPKFNVPSSAFTGYLGSDLEIVKDFERTEHRYID